MKSKEKKIKTRIQNKPESKKTSENSKKKKFNSMTLILLSLTIAIVLSTYSILGIEFAAIVGVLFAVLWFFGFLISRIKNRKKRRRVITALIIFFLLIGIAILGAFCFFLNYIKTQADPKFTVTKLNTV